MGWPKSSFGFLHPLTENPERTFWPTQYKQSLTLAYICGCLVILWFAQCSCLFLCSDIEGSSPDCVSLHRSHSVTPYVLVQGCNRAPRHRCEPPANSQPSEAVVLLPGRLPCSLPGLLVFSCPFYSFPFLLRPQWHSSPALFFW